MKNLQNTDWFGIDKEYPMHNYVDSQFYDYSIGIDYDEIRNYQIREEEIRLEFCSNSGN